MSEHVKPLIIRRKNLPAILDLSIVGVWRLENEDPTFPPRIKIGQRGVGYRVVDIEKWIDSRTLTQGAI